MKAMILAAGRGERMRPLTDHCPKPLLDVAGEPLIAWHLKRLRAAGISDVVINHAWFGEQIESRLGQGDAYGLKIAYSAENVALETAGGIAHALPLLGDDPFLVVNGDIFTDYPFANLLARLPEIKASGVLAHLVMVPKAGYPTGRDLALDAAGKVIFCDDQATPRTFAGIALYHPDFFAGVAPDQPSALLPLFLAGMAKGQLSGELFTGQWLDVGTIERLEQARVLAAQGSS